MARDRHQNRQRSTGKSTGFLPSRAFIPSLVLATEVVTAKISLLSLDPKLSPPLRPLPQAWMDGLMQRSEGLMHQFSARELSELLPAVVKLHQSAYIKAKGEVRKSKSEGSLDHGAGSKAGPGSWSLLAAISNATEVQPEGCALGLIRRTRRRQLGPLLMMQHPQQSPQHHPQQQPKMQVPRGVKTAVVQHHSVADEGPTAGGSPPGIDVDSSPLIDPKWTKALLESCRFKLARFTAQVRRQ